MADKPQSPEPKKEAGKRWAAVVATVKEIRHPRRFWGRHRRLTLGIAAALVLCVAGAVVAYESLKRPGDVHNEHAAFKPEKPKRQVKRTVPWPIYGYDRSRTRYLPAKGMKPPFRKLWRYTERPLLEFPPVVAAGRLFLANNSGYVIALDDATGRQLWKRRIGRLNASSPAFSKNRLYVVNLVPGHIVKLDARTGRVLWKRILPGRTESSPLVIGRSVYFGCEDGNLYSLSTKNGNVRWATALGGPVKSAPAYYGGNLYVGDYGGYMNAVDAKTGKVKWQSGSLGPGFGGTGEFYSTPAVAFGRVYAGNNDSRVYSFEASNGELAWSYSTGGYAYSGPAVARTKHTGPTVYIGSFDGHVYALNAKTGEPRWIEDAGGPVIGSLTAVGNIVYAAEFEGTSTTGYAMKTGRPVFHYPRGTYTPVVSDGRRLYLIGYSSISALEPVRRSHGSAASSPRAGAGRGRPPASHPSHPRARRPGAARAPSAPGSRTRSRAKHRRSRSPTAHDSPRRAWRVKSRQGT
jgi:outer membrane protein assembly factor BamB